MTHRVFRSCAEPNRKRESLSWEELWTADDIGLITCWEVGREMRERNPELAHLAEKGELPILGWKGGVSKALKTGEKYGSLFYLAQWQGLRGDDLDIDSSKEIAIVCSKTGIRVIYTADLKEDESD